MHRDSAAAQRRINAWVSQQTNGRIARALAAPPPPSTAVIMSNSIYMKAAWRFPFSRELTAPGIFRPSLGQQVRDAVRRERDIRPAREIQIQR